MLHTPRQVQVKLGILRDQISNETGRLPIPKDSHGNFYWYFCNIIMTGEPTHTTLEERMVPS